MSETKSLITVEALVNAPVEKVWKCWTDPAHITKWNFADPSWHCPSAVNDFRVGGKYSARMEAKDGSFGFDFESTYDKIENEKLLELTMGDGRYWKVTFESKGNSTLVTEIFEAESQNPVDMQKGGWQLILNNFKNYTEKN